MEQRRTVLLADTSTEFRILLRDIEIVYQCRKQKEYSVL